MTNYLELPDYFENVSIIDRGNREVQSVPASWAQYYGVTGDVEGYFYTTLLMYRGKLLTLHTWSLEPDWQDMDDTVVEFLSNIK